MTEEVILPAMGTRFIRPGIPSELKIAKADGNSIWLNANSCVQPTVAFRLWLADEVLVALSNPHNTLRDPGSLVEVLYLSITKS